MLELLNVLKETENDDITSVVQKIIATYYDQLAPIMYDICQNLVCILFKFNSVNFYWYLKYLLFYNCIIEFLIKFEPQSMFSYFILNSLVEKLARIYKKKKNGLHLK